jgi:hypothetical protein
LVFFRIFRIPFLFFVRLQSFCCAHELVITLNELNTKVGSWSCLALSANITLAIPVEQGVQLSP